MVLAFHAGKVPAAIPALRADLGLSLVAAGWAVSLFNAVPCLLGLIAGAFADLIGARRVIVGGLVVAGIASAAGALATGGAWLLAFRFLEGFGATAVFVAAPMIILRAVAVRHQRLAFGIWSAYMPAGTALMILITPLALDLAGWRGLWLGIAGLMGLYAVIFAAGTRAIPDPPAAPGRLARIGGDAGAVLRARGPWLLALAFGCYTGTFLSVTSFLPTLLIEAGGYTLVSAGTVTALVVACNVAGNVAGGWILQRGAPRGLLIVVAAATMGTLGLVIYAGGFGATVQIVCAVVFAAVGGLLPAACLGGAPVHAPSPDTVGTTTGLILQGANAGQLATPPVFAAIAAAAGWSAAPWFTAALSAVACALGLALFRHERRRALARPAVR